MLQDLYQELIVDHGKNPRNFRPIEHARSCQHGNNPLCGDRIILYVQHDDLIISDIAFQGEGCAICMSSASLMTQVLKGMSLSDAQVLFQHFHDSVVSGVAVEGAQLGKLEALLGVSQYPTRVKCATLAWHTLVAALEGNKETVSTE